MDIYIYIIVIALVLSIVFNKKPKLYLSIIFTILTLVSAFRHYSVGTDTKMYWDDFLKISRLPFLDFQSVRYE